MRNNMKTTSEDNKKIRLCFGWPNLSGCFKFENTRKWWGIKVKQRIKAIKNGQSCVSGCKQERKADFKVFLNENWKNEKMIFITEAA